MAKKLKSSHKNYKKKEKNTLYKGFNPKNDTKIEPKVRYLEHISEQLGISEDIIAGAPIVKAIGQRKVSIENYKGIIEFNRNYIKIQAIHCRIIIKGVNLNIAYFSNDEMLITGCIKELAYE